MTPNLQLLLLVIAAAVPQQRWELSEELRIGALDGPNALTRVDDIVITSGDRVAITQRIQGAVRFFDARTGRALFTVGRKGEGPGEFRTITALSILGDTVFASDMIQARVVLLSGQNGTVLDTRRIASSVLEETRRPAVPYAITPSGMFWARTGANMIAVANKQITQVPIVVMTTSGRIAHRIGAEDWSDAVSVAVFGRKMAVFRQPLVKPTLTAIAHDGSSAVFVTVRATHEDNGEVRVVRIGHSGDTIFDRSFRYRPMKVSRRLKQEVWNRFVQVYGEGVPLRIARAAAQEFVTIPAYVPPFSAVMAGIDGSTWIKKRTADSGDSAEWVVLDAVGDFAATVSAPTDLVLHFVSRREAWGVVEDDLEVPYVVRYAIVQK